MTLLLHIERLCFTFVPDSSPLTCRQEQYIAFYPAPTRVYAMRACSTTWKETAPGSTGSPLRSTEHHQEVAGCLDQFEVNYQRSVDRHRHGPRNSVLAGPSFELRIGVPTW